MKIGILGGTGKEGAGLAVRWAQAGHEIVIGSRDAERARTKAAELTAPQKKQLLSVIDEYVGNMPAGHAKIRMAEVEQHLDDTYFAWSGPTTKGSVAYFRIQGPTLVIEYAPQKTVDHIHTIYRDPTNDYGAKFVAK